MSYLIDPGRFHQICGGNVFFVAAGNLPYFPGNYPWNERPPQNPSSAFTNVGGLASFPLPQISPLNVLFPVGARTNTEAVFWTLLDAWNFNGAELELYCTALCEIAVYGTDVEALWSDLDKPGDLTNDEFTRLRSRWAAVHTMIEVNAWYNWSIADSPTSLSCFTSKYIYHTADAGNPANTANSVIPNYYDKDIGIVGLEHNCFLPQKHGTERSNEVNGAYRNPASAAIFGLYLASKHRLATGFDAVSAVVEFIHGQSNAYATSWPIVGYNKTIKPTTVAAPPPNPVDVNWDNVNWGLGNSTFENPPKAMFHVPLDGNQAWIHAIRGGQGYAPSDWFSNELVNHNVTPTSFGAMRTYKIGGCGPMSHFFVAALAGMGVPAVWGINTWAYKDGIDFHSTVRLPLWGLGVYHGDDLWGPGASLFPARDLFFEEEVVFSAARDIKKLFDSGFVYYDPNNNKMPVAPPLSIGWNDAKTIPLRATQFARNLQTASFSQYLVGRAYISRILRAGLDIADRRQVLLDAVVYRACGQSPIKKAFGAIREWMKGYNPAVSQNYGNVYKKDIMLWKEMKRPWDVVPKIDTVEVQVENADSVRSDLRAVKQLFANEITNIASEDWFI